MKYKKKPVIIEATQFIKLGDHPKVLVDSKSPTGFSLFTLESTIAPFEVTLGDWIITGTRGENYACKDSIFRETYEREDGTPV